MNAKAPFPSATVVLVRDSAAGLEVLLVCRSEQVQHMGGMWVFPGGRVDPADEVAGADAYSAALNAAIRETAEEAGLNISAQQLHHISHWTTPPEAKKRFATWFFVGVLADDQEVIVDGGEISHHRWVKPGDALRELERGELRLMPPTFVTLLELIAYADAADLTAAMASHTPLIYEPCITELDGDFHFLYAGDAGYDSRDPAREGERHRCIMSDGQLTYLRQF